MVARRRISPFAKGLAMSGLLAAALACSKTIPPRAPLSQAGEGVYVLVDRPQSDSYRAVGDLVGIAADAHRSSAIAAATDSVRNQAAELGAAMIFIQRVDAEVEWRDSLTLVKVYATAYKNEQ